MKHFNNEPLRQWPSSDTCLEAAIMIIAVWIFLGLLSSCSPNQSGYRRVYLQNLVSNGADSVQVPEGMVDVLHEGDTVAVHDHAIIVSYDKTDLDTGDYDIDRITRIGSGE